MQTLDPSSWMLEVEKQGHGTRLAKPLSQQEQYVLHNCFDIKQV